MPDSPDATAPGSLYEDWDLLRRVDDDFVKLAGAQGVTLAKSFRHRAEQLNAIVESLRDPEVQTPESWHELQLRLYTDRRLRNFISGLRGRGDFRDGSIMGDVHSETCEGLWLVIIRNAGRWFHNRALNTSWRLLAWRWVPTLAIRAARRIRGRPELQPTRQTIDDESVIPLEQSLASGDLPPDIQAVADELRKRMCQGLSAKVCDLLVFRGEGMSNRKIASELGESLDAVKNPVQSARRKIRKKLEDKLARLDPDDAQIIRLLFFEGKPISKLAESLDISPDKAKQRLRQAISRFKELLDP